LKIDFQCAFVPPNLKYEVSAIRRPPSHRKNDMACVENIMTNLEATPFFLFLIEKVGQTRPFASSRAIFLAPIATYTRIIL